MMWSENAQLIQFYKTKCKTWLYKTCNLGGNEDKNNTTCQYSIIIPSSNHQLGWILKDFKEKDHPDYHVFILNRCEVSHHLVKGNALALPVIPLRLTAQKHHGVLLKWDNDKCNSNYYHEARWFIIIKAIIAEQTCLSHCLSLVPPVMMDRVDLLAEDWNLLLLWRHQSERCSAGCVMEIDFVTIWLFPEWLYAWPQLIN